MQRGSRRNRWLDSWVGTPALNLFATVRRRRSAPQSTPRNLGVLCSPALGDTLLFSGALQDLRQALPHTEITHVCMRQNLAAAEVIPGADRRLLVDLTRPGETIQRLRAERFDVFLDFTSWQRLTAFYTLLSGARYTVGFATAGQYRSRGYDRTVTHRADCHETMNFRALLERSDLRVEWPTAHYPKVVCRGTPATVFPEDTDLVAFHPWASGQRAHLREWPEQRWIELAVLLSGGRTRFLITGAPSDRPRAENLASALNRVGLRAEAFISPDGFQTLAQVLVRCRLVVTVNTGVMHLAAIAGARTVSINGPNRNERWGPIGPRALGVEAPGLGCGFLHLGFNFHGNPEDCMERISVEMVLDACKNLQASTGVNAESCVDEQIEVGGECKTCAK